MTEQLHDLLVDIADHAGPASHDPTLWARARQARRRDRALRASAMGGLCAVAVVGAILIGTGSHAGPPPADRPTPTPTATTQVHGEGIPTTVRGLLGDAGLQPETNLAVGSASVAIANPNGAFVITAADGVYHRLQLPGFDPTAFNEQETGLALSPDGTRLAYGWRAPQGASGPEAGVRTVNLRTGAVKRVDPSEPFIKTYGFGWSPNGRYLVWEAWTKDPSNAIPEQHWYGGADTTTGRESFLLHETKFATCTTCSRLTLINPQHLARFDAKPYGGPSRSLVTGGVLPEKAVVTDHFLPIPGDAPWTVGRFRPDGRRILLQPDGVGDGLLLVTDSNPAPYEALREDERRYDVTLLPLNSADWPNGARIDVLGWVGPNHALARFNRGTGPDTWELGGDLVLVDISAGDPVAPKIVGHVEAGDPGSTYTFATDFATLDAPTQDFG
jgi:hypothetical protein